MARYQVKTVQPQAGPQVHRAHAAGEQTEVTFDFHAQLLPLIPGDVARLAPDHSLPYACNGTVVAQAPGQLLASFGSLRVQLSPWLGNPGVQPNDAIALSIQTKVEAPLGVSGAARRGQPDWIRASWGGWVGRAEDVSRFATANEVEAAQPRCTEVHRSPQSRWQHHFGQPIAIGKGALGNVRPG